MSKAKIRVCDTCGKTTPRKYVTQHKWFRLDTLRVRYRHDNTRWALPNRDILSLWKEHPPDFCSKKCLLTYLDSQLTLLEAK